MMLPGFAQDEPALRDYAAENDIYIGAAAWTSHLSIEEHGEVLAREFNMLTPEHEAKFCMISPARGVYEFNNFDRLIEFAEEHDMAFHGHVLIWHSCSPAWLENGDFTRDEAIEILEEHITTVVGRYAGRIPYWDVINEAFEENGDYRDTFWLRTIGPEYIEMAFEFAHAADPDAILLYNDYNIEEMNAKSDAVYAMAQDFLERDIPLHAIGMQSHLILGQTDFESVAENMARLHELELEVQLTEIDIRHSGEANDNILEWQAEEYAQLMTVCLEAENCTAFIVWGVSDNLSWLRQPYDFFNNPNVEPLLFTETYEPKPAYFAVRDVLMNHSE
jgi:GH35 family endo-1,4-beta-xylanase